MEDASGWEEATHPLVQTTDERRDVKGSGGGDEDASDVAALSAAEECQSAIVLGAVWVWLCNTYYKSAKNEYSTVNAVAGVPFLPRSPSPCRVGLHVPDPW